MTTDIIRSTSPRFTYPPFTNSAIQHMRHATLRCKSWMNQRKNQNVMGLWWHSFFRDTCYLQWLQSCGRVLEKERSVLQDDTSGCANPAVDFKTKVLFRPSLAWPGQAKAELLFWNPREVLHNLMCHPVPILYFFHYVCKENVNV